MGMGGNGNVESHSRTSLVKTACDSLSLFHMSRLVGPVCAVGLSRSDRAFIYERDKRSLKLMRHWLATCEWCTRLSRDRGRRTTSDEKSIVIGHGDMMTSPTTWCVCVCVVTWLLLMWFAATHQGAPLSIVPDEITHARAIERTLLSTPDSKDFNISHTDNRETEITSGAFFPQKLSAIN